MASTFICNLVHFTWSTFSRRQAIKESWRSRLHEYLGGIARNKAAKPLAVGGVDDHVHLFASVPATLSLAELAGALKANSSRWIHQNISGQDKFAWQQGYAAFSVSKSAEERVTAYINKQEDHHRRQSFQEEFLTLLEKHGI